MKKYHIIANWKMQLGVKESVDLFNEIKNNIPEKNNSEVVICPSFISLNEINKIKGDDIKLGGQNVFWEEIGAYTGETSCKMLIEAGAQYVMLGHSDRRKWCSIIWWRKTKNIYS